MPTQETVSIIFTESLCFDPENPRFYRLNDGQMSEPAVVDEMVKNENVQDLMASIGQKGYFEGEPLLVLKPKSKNGCHIVVEGNRRLAAVKLLNGEIPLPVARRKSLQTIVDEANKRNIPRQLPCLIYTKRKDVLRYLGYRHITGIKEWDSLSKAQYLLQLKNEFYSDESPAEQLRSLAREIGSRSDYVGQLLSALKLYSTAKDRDEFFGLPIREKDIEFSYLTTALNYPSLCDWLGLEGRSDVHQVTLREENLKKAFSWMFAKDQQGRTILGESRNLRELAAIVRSPEAVAALEKTGQLSEAYLYTDGPEVALERALEVALGKTKAVYNMLSETKATKTHAELAESLFENVKLVRTVVKSQQED